MTEEQYTTIGKHFDELHIAASGFGLNISDAIRDALKASYLTGADYALDIYLPHWISVDDALPEVYEPVLAAAGSHFAVVAIRDNFDWYDSKFGGEKISGITHWQRLPAPPKKGD